MSNNLVIQYQNPQELYNPVKNGYSHISIVDLSKVSEVIHIAGQGGENATGVLAESFVEQCQQVFLNLQFALNDCQLSWNNIAKMQILVVSHDMQKLQYITQFMNHYFPQQNFPACTLIPVASLALPNMLLEIDATAYRFKDV